MSDWVTEFDWNRTATAALETREFEKNKAIKGKKVKLPLPGY